MKEIELTQGQVALVDDEDFDYLSQWKWHAAWNKPTRSYYARRRFSLKMHRIILERILGYQLQKNQEIDHINHDTLDNRRKNLRLVTRSQNKMNGNKQKNNTSGYKGVSWDKDKQKWRSRIQINSNPVHLGYFNSPEDAYEAYCKAADELFGEFAYYE